MKTYEITFTSTTYRTYSIQAEDVDTAEFLASEVLEDDEEVTRTWFKNAEIDDIRET